MAFAHHGIVRLYYETLGDMAGPVVLLLNGAGRQATDFTDPFCTAITDLGFGVIRFDQRDTGRSTGFADIPPDATGVASAIAAGNAPRLPYSVDDLAADAVAVIDAAGVRRAHLFGRSLGGFVAQLIALDYPERILSLTIAMAFSRAIGASVPPARLRQLDAERFDDPQSFITRQIETARLLGNPMYFDETAIRAEAARAFRRGVPHGSIARHFMIGLAAPDLRPRLATLTLPVQLIHGAGDKVIPLAMAAETAAAIPGARLDVLDDMAHEAPPQLWDRWIALFAANAASTRG